MSGELFNDLPFNLSGESQSSELTTEAQARVRALAESEARKAQTVLFESKSVQMFKATCSAYKRAELLTELLVEIKYGAPVEARAKIEHALNSLYHAQVMINSGPQYHRTRLLKR